MHVDDTFQVGYLLLEWFVSLAISLFEFEKGLLFPEIMGVPLAEFNWALIWRMNWLFEDGAFSRELIVIGQICISAGFDIWQNKIILREFVLY